VATATEIMAALRCGASTLKLFPAAVVGGVGAVRALSAPFPHARFVPTGGIGVDDVGSYLRLPSVAAVGGSWIAPADLLRRGDYREIAGRAAQAATAARRAREGGRA
jgi:2-dehydro-3-deoxyphosphogluconate aldolase/(4S)-4-hydroxy-2-oxoglutarate aldolase